MSMPQLHSSGTLLHSHIGVKNRYGRITTLVFPLFALLFIIGTAALQLIMLNNAQAAAPVQMHGTLTPLLAESRVVGKADPQKHITLSLGLQPPHMAALQSYVQEIVHPGSPHYHHFLSPEQFVATYSPTEASYNALRTYAQEEGFTITHTYSHRLLLTISGTLAQAEQAFHVAFHTYRSADGMLYYANDQEPELPAMLAKEVQSVVGLNDALTWQHSLAPQQRGQENTPPASAHACPVHNNRYLTPDQVNALYHLQPLVTQHLQGEGQTVALFELASVAKNDLSTYTGCFGHAHTTIQAIPTGSGPIPADSGMLEAQMDAELVLSAVPQLNTLKIYEAANDASDVLAEWAQIIQDAPPVVSMSWGICELKADEALVRQENLLFTAAAAQGQSIFASSGDSGSSGCGDDHLSADDPSTQPLVTGVGGTMLTPHGTEQVWKTATSPSSTSTTHGVGASGGGISQYWSAPSWQDAPGVHNVYSTGAPCHAASGVLCREAPDVALQVDPHHGYLVYCTVASAGCTTQHPWIVAGGTSTAAPLWAALAVQANELSLRQGGTPLGMFNPLLYQIARSRTSYARDFHDVTKGNTDLSNTHNGAYPATSGYDMATGLGSYDGSNLVKDLVALNIRQQVSHPSPVSTTWYFAEGSVGGSFQQYVTLHNPSPLQDSEVTLYYLFQDKGPVAVKHIVKRNSRLTVSVNSDLHVAPTDRQVAVSMIAEVAKGDPGVVAERPMYFTYRGIQSGTDVIGATAPALSYYFPTVDTRQQGRTYDTYLTLLNPSAQKKATATLTYYTGVCGPVWQTPCPTQKIEIAPQRRATISPEMLPPNQQMSASVRADVPIIVERTLYVKDTIPQTGGVTTGATSEIGATSPATQWRFAEGNTGPAFQEDLMLANFGNVDTTAHIRLEYDNGHSQMVNVSVPGQGQMLFDVNQANSQPTGTCDTSLCQTTPAASIEVTADDPIVVERLMYFQKSLQMSLHKDQRISGVATTLGEAGPAVTKTYAFAEGFTGSGFEEFLTLHNPTTQDETVSITFFVNTYILHRQVIVQAHSRQTLDINALVVPVVQGHQNLGSDSYAVAMTVQVQNGGQLLAERSMYFNYHGAQGGSVVIGYTQ